MFALQLMDSVRDSSQENIGQAMKTQFVVETKMNAASSYLCQSDAAAASGLDIRSFQQVVNYVLPVAFNSVCVAPCDEGWYRCQIVAYDEESGMCSIKYRDYGGYHSIDVNELRQIRTDFLSFPFQATECYLANWFEKEGSKKIYRTGAGRAKKGEKDRDVVERQEEGKKMGIRLR